MRSRGNPSCSDVDPTSAPGTSSPASRLLPQPGGLEGLGSIPEDPYARELAAFKFVEVRERLSLRKAALRLQIQGQERQNSVIAKRLQALDFQFKPGRALAYAVEESADSRFASV
jgi:hypothetical protein